MGRAGLPQVEYALAEPGSRDLDLARIGLPCWVKPARLGSSVGIVKVSEEGELERALDTAFEHDARVIVEASAPGLEVECSVLGHTHAAEASEPGEIVLASGDGWYDYEAKYTPGGMELVVPARISAPARERVRELAVEAFRIAGCSGLARADFFVDGERVLLNELNTMPGFTQTSVYGKLWQASGLPYEDLVDRLCALAVERHAAERAQRF
jgi:D-alanine-D-alanine ligase